MSESHEFEYVIEMRRKDNYKFEVDFESDQIPKLLTDEPPSIPGGEGRGPTASMLLAAAIGNCLSASLTFCATKKRVEIQELKTTVKLTRKRNENGFWRISKIHVDLEPTVEEKEGSDYKKCKEMYEDYCIVSQSVKNGIPLEINLIQK